MVIKLDEQLKPTGFPILEDNFRKIFPEITFPQILFPAHVEPHGYGMYEFSHQPQVTERYGKVVEVAPIRDEQGYWRQQWAVVEQTAEEKIATDANKEKEVRGKRMQRLYMSDWTQIADAPLTQDQRTAWTAHRQALRDVPSQPGFPWSVNWPSTPSS